MITFLTHSLGSLGILMFTLLTSYVYFYYIDSKKRFALATVMVAIVSIIMMLIVWTCWCVLHI